MVITGRGACPGPAILLGGQVVTEKTMVTTGVIPMGIGIAMNMSAPAPATLDSNMATMKMAVPGFGLGDNLTKCFVGGKRRFVFS